MRALAAMAGTVALLGCTPGAETGARMAAGEPAPGFWSPGPDTVVVGWALRGADLIRCDTEADELRRILHGMGARVRLSVAATGADSALVSSFLRTERLPAELVVLGERDFRGHFGEESPPVLYLIQNDTVADVVRPSRGQGSGGAKSLDRSIRRALGAPELFSGSADPSTSTGDVP